MVSQRYGLVEREEFAERPASSESLIGYKICQVNDLILNKLKAYLGVFFRASISGIVSPDYTVFRAIDKIEVDYFEHLFKTPLYISELNRESKGIVIGFFRLYTPDFYNLFSVFPPIKEQKQIVNYIRRKSVEIDRFISNKQRLIELLQEQKTAIINRAVTKGLNPHAPMKPSSIEWLGEIPAHWEVQKHKRSIKIIEQGWSPLCHNQPATPEQWGVLKVGAVNGGIFRESENKALPDNLEPIKHYEIESGDLLISRANCRELLGSAAVVGQVRPKLILCDKLYRVKLKDEILSKYYLNYMLATPFIRYQMESAATGSSDSMQNISQEKIKYLEILLPPITEQNAITTYINDELVKISEAIAKIEKEIELIQEYRTTLISDAVTGKIDVRETSAVETTLTTAAI